MASKLRSVRSVLLRRKAASPGLQAAKSLDPPDPPGPPAVTPVDPEGESASRSTDRGSDLSRSEDRSSSDASAASLRPLPPGPAMTASQFAAAADEDVAARRAAAGEAAAVPRAVRDGRACQVRSREGVPVVTSAGADHFNPSAVAGGRGNYATEGFYSRSKKGWGGRDRPRVRPSAKCSAFGGAPRYDWMDIETTAAVKIQALFRRRRTQDELDARGLSTPGMRNRRARLRSRRRADAGRRVAADAPFPFSLCGVGLLFGDGTLEDEEVVQGLERRKAAEQRERAEREDEERRTRRSRKGGDQQLEEGVEVVESFEEGGGSGGEGGTASEPKEEAQGRRGRSGRWSRLGRSAGRSVG